MKHQTAARFEAALWRLQARGALNVKECKLSTREALQPCWLEEEGDARVSLSCTTTSKEERVVRFCFVRQTLLDNAVRSYNVGKWRRLRGGGWKLRAEVLCETLCATCKADDESKWPAIWTELML